MTTHLKASEQNRSSVSWRVSAFDLSRQALRSANVGQGRRLLAGAIFAAMALYALLFQVFAFFSKYSGEVLVHGVAVTALAGSCLGMLALYAHTFLRWFAYRGIYRKFVHIAQDLEPEAQESFKGQLSFDLQGDDWGFWNPRRAQQLFPSVATALGLWAALVGLVSALFGATGWEALGFLPLLGSVLLTSLFLGAAASFSRYSLEGKFAQKKVDACSGTGYGLLLGGPKWLYPRPILMSATLAVFMVSATTQAGFLAEAFEAKALTQVLQVTQSKDPPQTQVLAVKRIVQQPAGIFIQGVRVYSQAEQGLAGFPANNCVVLAPEQGGASSGSSVYVCSRAMNGSVKTQLQTWARRLTSRQLESLATPTPNP